MLVENTKCQLYILLRSLCILDTVIQIALEQYQKSYPVPNTNIDIDLDHLHPASRVNRLRSRGYVQ